MKVKYLFILALLILNFYQLYSQKEYFNWYFSDAAITFDTPNLEPKALTDSKMNSYEGCSSISDSVGNLLFYTDGITVWNCRHDTMANGFGLMGYFSSTQSALIVKQPGYEKVYFIFTFAVNYDTLTKVMGFRYSIVDMNLNNGLGGVTKKNILILNVNGEKLTAVKHRNGTDIWIIVHPTLSAAFHSYLLSKKGLTYEKSSSIGPEYDTISAGYLKISPDGSKIAAGRIGYNNYLKQSFGELLICDFDNETGEVSNPIKIDERAYGIEFSPDCSKLYFTADDRVFQVNLLAGSGTEIINSQKVLLKGGYHDYHALQLGPDGKIYLTENGKDYLGAIQKPNLTGDSCQVIEKAVFLEGKYTAYGLPNCVQSAFEIRLQLEPKHVCLGDTLFLKAGFTMNETGENYHWRGPGGFTSDEQNPVIPDAGIENEGWYYASGVNKGRKYEDSIYISVHEINAEIVTDKPRIICEGDSVRLTAKPDGSNFKYLWSTGETTKDIVVKKTGNYKLTVEDFFGCSGAEEIDIIVSPELQPEIMAPDALCYGGSAVLKAEPYDTANKYKWSTGETTPEITVTQPGKYFVYVETPSGCNGNDTVELKQYPVISFAIQGDTIICKDGSGTLISSKKFSYYEWSTGETTRDITISKSGEYSLTVTDINGCKTSDTIQVEYYPDINPAITGNPQFCEGSQTTLSADKDYTSYLWSTGETTKAITVDKPGDYYLYVTNEKGCKDTVSISVEYFPNPKPQTLYPKTICKGDTAIISPDKDYATYLWSTGETTKEISISQPGQYWLKISDENGCEGYDTVNIGLKEVIVSFTPSYYDFGYIMLGEKADGHVILKNEGDEEVKYIVEERKTGVFNNGKQTGSVAVSGEAQIDFSFIPTDIIDYFDTLIVKITEPCEVEFKIPLSGMGRLKALAELPQITANIGERICIPVYASLITDGGVSSTGNFSAEIALDADAAVTDDPGTISNGRRTIQLTGNGISIGKDKAKIGEICGTAVLGLRNISPLTFTTFSWSDKHVIADTVNGSLELKGVCIQDVSKIKSFTKTLMQIMPNPANEALNIYIESEEKGFFTLEIYNMQGARVLVNSWNNFGKSEREITINTENFADGIYQAVVRTPAGVLKENLIVIK